MSSPTSLRLPPDIEGAMKELARGHDRSINSEIIQACKAWIAAEREKAMAENIYTNNLAEVATALAASKVVGTTIGGRHVRVNALSQASDGRWIATYSHRDWPTSRSTDVDEDYTFDISSEYSTFRW